jgi:hypothetical protein
MSEQDLASIPMLGQVSFHQSFYVSALLQENEHDFRPSFTVQPFRSDESSMWQILLPIDDLRPFSD